MAYVGNINRHSAVTRRSLFRPGEVNLWAGRIAASASFAFIAILIFGL